VEREEIIRKFEELNVWKRGDERAPHKPLLVLYAMGKLLSEGNQSISFAEAEKDLKALLKEFGPWRRGYHPEQPFWRLRKDGVWEIPEAYKIREGTKQDGKTTGNPYIGDLRNYGVGSFPETIAEKLKSDVGLVFEITGRLLTSHFPISYHEDILQAVGIELSFELFGVHRDPNFRHRILEAYNHECTVCGFHVTLRDRPVALEAAHIKWWVAGGRDVEGNGIALCSLHHKLFDRGAFTLSAELEILVSEYANGAVGFEEWLMRFHGNKIRFPQNQTYYPRKEFIVWHLKEVFKGPNRANA